MAMATISGLESDTEFLRASMVLNETNEGVWEILGVDVVRPGRDSYKLAAANPVAADGISALPAGRPFRCTEPRYEAGRGMVARLTFDVALLDGWHHRVVDDPFDAGRVVKLKMLVGNKVEYLYVTLS